LNKSHFYIFLVILLTSLSVRAQKPFYRNYTVEDGLVSSTVYSIHQDHEGFIWFTTESGVSKFDGIFFKNFGREDGLGDNEIFSVFEDSKNRLWFFPFNGRLSYYHQGLIYNAQSDSLLKNLEINTIFSKPFEDAQGRLWIGTTRDKKIAFYSKHKSCLIPAPHKDIEVVAVNDGSLKLLSRGFLYTYSFSWDKDLPILGEILSKEEYKSASEPLPQIEGYQISDFLVDREANKWYSTLGNGVLMSSRTYVKFLDKESGLNFDNVYSVVNLVDSSLLTGFKNGTLQMWSRTQSIKTVLSKGGYNRIIDIFIHDDLWIASDQGLYVLDKKTMELKHHYPGSIKCLTQYEDQLYFGTSSSAFKVRFDEPDSVQKIFNERTISIHVQNDSNILIGTNKGLRLVQGDSIIDLSHEHRLLSGRIRAMCALSDKITILGTHGEGVLVQNAKEGTYHVLNMDNGLSSNICQAIFKENDSILWLGTNNGLNRIKFINGKYDQAIVDIYKRSDGLKSNYINDIFVDKNQVFVASDKGVSFFQIQKEQKKSKPIAYLYRIAINDQDTAILPHYDLEHFQNKVAIAYSGIAFESGKNTKFMYRVLGLDSAWTTTNLRELSFQAIPAGKYQFELFALATDGSKSEEAVLFSFTIHKPFWKTWWFIFSLLAVLLFLVWRITRFIIAYNHRKDVEEKNKALEEKNEVIEKERQRSEELLLNILPEDTAEELKQNGSVKAKHHDHATVFFSDFEGFTNLASQVSPEELVHELDHCFRAYDAIIEKYQLEKVKTIGDAYMCAAGLNEDTSSDPKDVVNASLEIMEFMKWYQAEREKQGLPYFKVRIGLHHGPVVSGVVGSVKFAFDIWGDAVNTAARMESNGQVARLNVSHSMYELIKDDFKCTPRGKIDVKGKGEMEMYFVEKN